MSKIFAIEALKRENPGKSEARELRRNGRIPAIIYGNKTDQHPISVDFNEMTKRHHKGGFHSQLCEITLDGKKIQVIPKVLDRHPVTDAIQHIDFYELNEKEPVKIKVLLKFQNEATCVGVKRGGVVNIIVRRLEILCLPKDIISEVDVDLKDLAIGESVHISDLNLPEGVEALVKGDNPTVVTIVGKMAEETQPAEEEAAEGEENTEAAGEAEGDQAEASDSGESAEENKEG